MIELIRIDNRWVKESDLLTGDKVTGFYKSLLHLRESHPSWSTIEGKEIKTCIEEVKPCKTHDDIVKGFEGDEEIETNELSTRHREYILQKERMGSLRYVLGWNLYQEWVKETITGY